MRSTADLVPEYPAMAGNAIVAATAFSHCASSVTFSSTKPVLAPVFARRPAVSLPRSARMSPIITEAPAFVSASAIAAPMPRAPPVTRALRPARLFSLIVHSSLGDFIVATRRCLPSGQDAARWASPLLIKKRLSADRNERLGSAGVLPALPPRAQLLPAAMPGNLTLAQEYLDDRPKSIHLSSSPLTTRVGDDFARRFRA